jgi:protocadherin delta 2
MNLSYSLSSHGADGTVWTLGKLDFEEKNFYNISIIAYDRGTPSLSSVAKLWVTVADTNDAVPDFSKAVYTLEVAENAKPGDTVFTLNAGDGSFKYSLLSTFSSSFSASARVCYCQLAQSDE